MGGIERPAGVEQPNREFAILPKPRLVLIEERSRRQRLKEWFYDAWFYLRHISFGRGSDIEIDIPDATVEWLEQMGWIRNYKGHKRMTRKGSREFSLFLKEELEKFDDRRRKD